MPTPKQSESHLTFKASTLQPVTVLQSTGLNLDGSWAEKIISEFINKDDICNLDFLQVVIVTHASSASAAANLGLEPSAIAVPASYRPFDVSVFSPAGTVARIVVKDIYNLKGVETAGSSRSYKQLYPPGAESASSIQNLIDLGAIIVGKTKTTTLADREIPTRFRLETGLIRTPSSILEETGILSQTVTGLEVALLLLPMTGSIILLDQTISLASGSIRWLAAHASFFGFTPIYEVMPMDGIIPSSRQFDELAFLTRDVVSTLSFAHNWFCAKRFSEPSVGLLAPPFLGGTNQTPIQGRKPIQLLYPLDYTDPSRERAMSTNKEVLDVIQDFVKKLEVYLNVKRTPVDFLKL
ncbi:hypothetical protein HYALB_00010838 [Hymenoscyphus albidus]|uniref:Scytalone dehydratase-like protein Arp1 N-terminal domain-containing protein n=1 Tax=Hymenoscyphus albidus TaxID=595503 RepID=A0A9N9Q2T2_9HELO|nr:hypothetical protein HYALB_00010838 [Hymenoscyphus albidus]